MAQQGFVYESNVAKFLKPLGLVPSNFIPAGAGHDQPDLMLLYNNSKQGCELKITDASAGSLVIKYTPGERMPWGFGTIKKEDKEKIFISELAKEVNLFKEIFRQWNKIPYKIDKKLQDDKWLSTAGKLSPRERYARDHKLTLKDVGIYEFPNGHLIFDRYPSISVKALLDEILEKE